MIDESVLHQRHAAWATRVNRLYSFLSCHVLESPSLTVQWIPESKKDIPNKAYSVQNLCLGSYYLNQPNYLSLYSAFLPREWHEILYEDTSFEDDVAFMNYPDNIAEAGNRIHPYKRILHDGEVNIARVMPQCASIVATRGPSCQVHVTDFSRRRANPEDRTSVRPDMRLKGPKKEGFALAWSPSQKGLIASGGGDMVVHVWDIDAVADSLGTMDTIEANSTSHLTGHTDTVESVSWHPTHGNILTSSGADNHVILWDTRINKYQQKEECHLKSVYNVSFHPTGVFLLATTSADRCIRIWDMRRMRKPVYELVGHTDEVYGMTWSPFSDTILASYSKDATVSIWDISKMNVEADAVEDAHAHPSLVFRHYGHLDCVRDVAWNPHEGDEWVLASVDDSNQVHIWQPHKTIYDGEDNTFNVFDSDMW